MTEILYKELSYKLGGLIFKVDNQLGPGQTEKVYGDALEKLLIKESINYRREVYFPLRIDEEIVKRNYFDFLIEDKIVVELKTSDVHYKNACSQIFRYLKASDKKLGIIYRITTSGVRTKRIPNYY